MDTERPGRGSGCFGCDPENEIGLKLVIDRNEGEPRASGTWTPEPGHQGPKMHLHGGVASTVLDEAMARLAHLLDGRHSITAKLEVRFRKPVPLDGQALRIEAWRDNHPPESSRRHKLFARLSLADGTPAVEAEGLFVRLPPSG